MDLDRTLRETFGFEGLRPGQSEVVERLLQGRSVLAVFPTGGGKSLCYQLPALHLDGLTLVVSPLIALMKDQLDFLSSRGVAAARLDSSLTADEHRDVWDRIRSGQLKLLYVAPERFGNERFMARLRGVRIAMMAIDEAHCISEWGHNFRPDYLKLARLAVDLGAERILALTATATRGVADDIRAAFDIATDDHVHTGFHRPNLFLRMRPVAARDRDALLLDRLRAHPPGAAVVYVTLQRTAEDVARRLADAGLPARAYHAGMKPDERSAIQEWFMGEPHAIVVATIAFGMGIDKSDIRYVFHYNLPKALENYAQEIGRAGRDGAPSVCELFAVPDDVVTLENFSYGDTPTPEAVRGLVHELLNLGERFDVSRYDLSRRHDIRQLVVSTLLTYLELQGVLAATSPFYDTYKFKPLRSSAEILGRFDAQRAAFLGQLFRTAKKGRIWFQVDLTAAAETLGQPRQRLVSALEFLAQEGDLELKVSGVRHGYRVVDRPDDLDALADALSARFADAETRDIERLRGVLALAASPDCVTGALLGYFGETLPGPCGHCDRCAGEPIPEMPTAVPHTFTDDDRQALSQLRSEGHQALASRRQQARFLCALPSPAVGRARLRRHRLWGRFERVPFDHVLAFVESV
jgi:ATP-dependent DNA helicase RecQ